MRDNIIEKQLSENLRLYKRVMSTIHEGVLIVDDNLTFVYINEAAEKIGLQRENVIGKSLFYVFPHLKKENSKILKVLQTGSPIIDEVQTFVTYRGERITSLTSTFPFFQNGSIVGVFEVFENISAMQELSERLLTLQQSQRSKKQKTPPVKTRHYRAEDLIGKHPSIVAIRDKIPMIANSPSPIFLYGETGTGKEVLVQAIHSASQKHQATFIGQNCAAIPENLLEGILFGTAKGGFTGAEDNPGLIELADGGILFLDEINSMPKSLQAKLLRVLQEKKIRRIGSKYEKHVNTRFVAATNVHPINLLEDKEIRSDLYYRLNVIYFELPPLRYRKDDLPDLVEHFITGFNKQFGKKVMGIEDEVMDYFLSYDWPGNIRELKNMIERAMNLTNSDLIRMKDLQVPEYLFVPSRGINNPVLRSRRDGEGKRNLKKSLEELEIELIRQELQYTRGNISQAARNLDLPQQSLSNKIKKHNLHSYIYHLKSSPNIG